MIKYSQEIDKIIPALLAAQKAVKAAQKNTEGVYEKYANYEDVEQAVKEPLNNNDIFFDHDEGEPIPSELNNDPKLMDHDKVYYPVTTYLWHSSTQFMSTTTSVRLDMSKTNQANLFEWAKNLTYIKRNQLASLLGLPTGEADPEDKSQGKPKDEKGAVKKAQPPKRRKPKNDNEKFAIEKLEEKKTIEEIEKFQEITLAETDDKNFISWFNAEVKYYKEKLNGSTGNKGVAAPKAG